MLEATLSGVPRYRMLDTLRSFGLDQLTAHQEHGAAMARFVEWARSFARWVDDTALTADEPLANRRLLTELGNLRAAWHYARSADDLDLMADLVISLDWSANLCDLTEISSWAVELAGHPKLFDHERAASVLGAAAIASWKSLGDLDGARSLAERGVSAASEQDPLSRQRCLSALADVRLFEGRLDEAVELYLRMGKTRRHGTRLRMRVQRWRQVTRDVSLKPASSIAMQRAQRAPACSPSTTMSRARSRTSIALWSAAELHYQEALRLSELSGAAFVHALATVGFVSVHAASGDSQAALRGYGELIEYWERIGAWTQQWTTLRNLADLLDQLEDHDCASMLRTRRRRGTRSRQHCSRLRS